MKSDDAENIIKFNFEEIIYELIVKSNIPMPVVLNVLLVNIPYLKVLGNNTSILTNNRILDVFRNFLTGRIVEREMFSILESCVKNPEKTLSEIIDERKKGWNHLSTELENPDKIIIMGLGASGKSSITSIIFEGKQPEDVKNYHATIQYERTPVSLIKDLQILDCGGQDSFITAFLGEEKSEFIFSDLKVLIWVVDISDSKNVSTSKYYFDTAINASQLGSTLNQHSPQRTTQGSLFVPKDYKELIQLN